MPNSQKFSFSKFIMNKKYLVIFCILLGIFSISYWSFFPGGYTPDTYVSYLNSLGLLEYRVSVPPVFALYWKIFNNYNFAPLLINYLIFVTALLLSIKFTRNYYLAIISLIGICLPYILITYIFAWKDTALLSVLFLLTVLCLNRNKSFSYFALVIIISFVAFSLRTNAVFGIVPLLFYFLHQKFNILRSTVFLVIILVGFYVFNAGLIKFIFKAEPENFNKQSVMYTDIAKINYLQKKNVVEDIPKEFVNENNLDSENIDKMFKLYCDFSCNDILYMYPEWQGAKAFLHLNFDPEAINRLENSWFNKIIHNPFTYLKARLFQLNNSLWSTNLLYTPQLLYFDKAMFENIAGNSQESVAFDPQSKVFQPVNSSLFVVIRDFTGQKSKILDVVSYPGLYLILSVIIFFVFIFKSKCNDFYKLGIYVSASGILYTLGYLPIIPCTDYRYFIWTIFSFWISAGLLCLSISTGKPPIIENSN